MVDGIRGESPEYNGILHLFETEYDEHTHFWYGVAGINCRYDDIASIENRGEPLHFRVVVRLKDGRQGWCRKLNGVFERDAASDHATVALVGITALAVPERNT